MATRRSTPAAAEVSPTDPTDPPERDEASSWTFLTNHAHVLLCIAREPDVRLRDVAELVNITERAVQRIVTDLVDAGYVERQRHGRRNSYLVRDDLPLRHPIERHERVSSLIALVHGEAKTGGSGKS